MKKITINEIEQILLNTTDICEGEDTDHGKFEEDINNKLELEFAIKKLTKQDQEIIQMILGGFTYREIECELKVGSSTISGAKQALYVILNNER
jgi:DNA-binding NarL/FixJ family response regulator